MALSAPTVNTVAPSSGTPTKTTVSQTGLLNIATTTEKVAISITTTKRRRKRLATDATCLTNVKTVIIHSTTTQLYAIVPKTASLGFGQRKSYTAAYQRKIYYPSYESHLMPFFSCPYRQWLGNF